MWNNICKKIGFVIRKQIGVRLLNSQRKVEDITIYEMNERLRVAMGVTKEYNPDMAHKAELMKYIPKNQNDLPARSMQDSFCSVIIPLSTDIDLMNSYITNVGGLRLGRLLEDMDSFAVYVAQKHILIPDLKPNIAFPYVLVTILVDKIEYTDYVTVSKQDVRISGHVSLVGSSTMEVVVWLEQKSNNMWQKITRALFLMGARDPLNKASAPVNKIVPGNEEEKKILSGGEERKKRRAKINENSLFRRIPSPEEQKLIHDIYRDTMVKNSLHVRVLPPNSIWLEWTRFSSSTLCHPQYRNLHNKIFGGYLMRNSLELAFVTCLVFCKSRPALKFISDILFLHPVEVTDVLKMHSFVSYTEKNHVQVVVYTETLDPHKGIRSTSNTFHYTFFTNSQIPSIYPKTYTDCLLYIDGRRHMMDCLHGSSKNQ